MPDPTCREVIAGLEFPSAGREAEKLIVALAGENGGQAGGREGEAGRLPATAAVHSGKQIECHALYIYFKPLPFLPLS